MQKIIIGLGVVAIAVAGWFFLIKSDTVSYVAAMSDDVAELEQDLMEVEAQVVAGTLTPEAAAQAQVRIIERLDAINAATKNSGRAELTPAQRAQLLEALERLKQILIAYSATLVTIDDTVMEMPVAERPAIVRNRGGARSVALDTVVVVEAHVDEVVVEYETEAELAAEADGTEDAETATSTEDEMESLGDDAAVTDEVSDEAEVSEETETEATDSEASATDDAGTDEGVEVEAETEVGIELEPQTN